MKSKVSVAWRDACAGRQDSKLGDSTHACAAWFQHGTNPEPAIKFYEDCVGSDATRTMIATSPALLGSSIENRLKPRVVDCQEAGIPIDTGTVQRMAKYTEDQWSDGLAKLLKQQQQQQQQQLLLDR
jgi:hypothetical protein